MGIVLFLIMRFYTPEKFLNTRYPKVVLTFWEHIINLRDSLHIFSLKIALPIDYSYILHIILESPNEH